MMSLLLVFLLVGLGHFALWIFAHNCANAVRLPRVVQKPINLGTLVIAAAGPLLASGWIAYPRLIGGQRETASFEGGPGSITAADWPLWLLAYGGVCLVIALFSVPGFLVRYYTRKLPATVTEFRQTILDVQRHLGTSLAAPGLRGWLVRVPGNESLQLEICEKRFQVPGLDPRLAGLSIVHLSDLHYTGKISREYFEEVIRRANDVRGDLIAITGDLLDKRSLVEWFPQTLGRLQAPLGVYCVLGNHDLRVKLPTLRDVLAQWGIRCIGGEVATIEHRGATILLAGNELPWYRPAPPVPARNVNDPPSLRLLLSHTPDQIGWARQNQFDLMLAGHTHGGQICLPGVGPIISPSFYGVRYAAGSFDLPPTQMHVSRGISGKTPLRYRCRPELAKLVLEPK